MGLDVRSLIPADEVVSDSTNHFKPAWLLFFQRLLTGDRGATGSLLPVGLGFTGTPTITTGYYQNNGLTDLWIRIVPGTNTSSTAGTTYFPLPTGIDPTVDDYCAVVTTPSTAPAFGFVDSVTNRLYPPSWSNITTPITIRARLVTP